MVINVSARLNLFVTQWYFVGRFLVPRTLGCLGFRHCSGYGQAEERFSVFGFFPRGLNGFPAGLIGCVPRGLKSVRLRADGLPDSLSLLTMK
jgi:hypothetical protein